MGGWQYFRTLAEEGESPEIYTDPDSKIQKYRRLLTYLVIFLPIYIPIFTSNLPLSYPEVLRFTVSVVWLMFMTVYVVAIIQLIRRIKALEHL